MFDCYLNLSNKALHPFFSIECALEIDFVEIGKGAKLSKNVLDKVFHFPLIPFGKTGVNLFTLHQRVK